MGKRTVGLTLSRLRSKMERSSGGGEIGGTNVERMVEDGEGRDGFTSRGEDSLSGRRVFMALTDRRDEFEAVLLMPKSLLAAAMPGERMVGWLSAARRDTGRGGFENEYLSWKREGRQVV